MFKFSKKFLSLIMAILMLTMTAIGVNAEELITGIDDLLIDIGIIDPSHEEELMPMAAGGCYINGGMGFSSHDELVAYLRSKGCTIDNDNQVHHIVEQCQIKSSRSGFSPYIIHNEANVVIINSELHRMVSGYYSSKPEGYTTTYRDSMNGLSYQEQYDAGIDVLRMYGWNG